MRDSRLTEAIDHLADAIRTNTRATKLVEEIVDDMNAGNPEWDVITDGLNYLLTAQKAMELAQQHLLRAGISVVETCKNSNSVGSECILPAGHPNHHESRYGSRWTDQDKTRGAAAIAALYNPRGVRD